MRRHIRIIWSCFAASSATPSRSRFPLALAIVAGTVSGNAQAQAPTREDYLRRFDADGDGRVSLGEYQEYLSRGFHAMDRDGNGVLAAGELPPGVRTRTATTLESHRRALARMFDLLDLDNSGHLDARELTAPPR